MKKSMNKMSFYLCKISNGMLMILKKETASSQNVNACHTESDLPFPPLHNLHVSLDCDDIFGLWVGMGGRS